MPDTSISLGELEQDACTELRDRWANYRDEFYGGEGEEA